MKICALSDMHGKLVWNIEPCDLLVVCGDSVDLRNQRYKESTLGWYKFDFYDWASECPARKVVFIAGNHDNMMDCKEELQSMYPLGERISYLEDDLLEWEGLRIYGSPWCKRFGSWFFMADPKKLEEKFSQIPENIDLLLTHDVPYGCSDVLQESVPWNTGEHIGNLQLREVVLKKKPKIHLSGHLHSCSHDWVELGETKHNNVSVLSESYELTYPPLYFEV